MPRKYSRVLRVYSQYGNGRTPCRPGPGVHHHPSTPKTSASGGRLWVRKTQSAMASASSDAEPPTASEVTGAPIRAASASGSRSWTVELPRIATLKCSSRPRLALRKLTYCWWTPARPGTRGKRPVSNGSSATREATTTKKLDPAVSTNQLPNEDHTCSLDPMRCVEGLPTGSEEGGCPRFRDAASAKPLSPAAVDESRLPAGLATHCRSLDPIGEVPRRRGRGLLERLRRLGESAEP